MIKDVNETGSIHGEHSLQDDTVNMDYLFGLFKRRKRLFLIILISGLSFQAFKSLTSPRSWSGQFSIVLPSGDNSQSDGMTSGLLQAAGLSKFISPSPDIETRIEVLKSPIVLSEVFRFDLATNKSGLPKDLTYVKWIKDRFTFKQITGTKVLTVTYSSPDKSNIKPILEKTLSAFELYGQKSVLNKIRKDISYVEEQLLRYRSKAKESSTALDRFSLRYGINASGNITSSNIASLLPQASSDSLNNRSRFRDIVQNIESPSSSESLTTEYNSQLAGINKALMKRREVFTENDPGVKRLVKEKLALEKFIKATAGGFINLPGAIPGQDSNLIDPNQIVIKFKELKRAAERDIAALNTFENGLSSLTLKSLESVDPLEVISPPYVSNVPLPRGTLLNLIYAFLLSSFAGFAAALSLDRFSRKVYSPQYFLRHLDIKTFKILPAKKTRYLEGTLEKIAQDFNNTPFRLIVLNSQGESPVSRQIEILKRNIPISTDNYSELNKQDGFSADRSFVFVAWPGSISRTEVSNLILKIAQNVRIELGLIWIE